MAGMSFEEAKNRRDSLPAWQTFEESIKSGGFTGSVSRAGGSALSGVRNAVAKVRNEARKKKGANTLQYHGPVPPKTDPSWSRNYKAGR